MIIWANKDDRDVYKLKVCNVVLSFDVGTVKCIVYSIDTAAGIRNNNKMVIIIVII